MALSQRNALDALTNVLPQAVTQGLEANIREWQASPLLAPCPFIVERKGMYLRCVHMPAPHLILTTAPTLSSIKKEVILSDVADISNGILEREHETTVSGFLLEGIQLEDQL
jgi:hypothetical protein